jgi:hypothetical protein
MPPPPGSACMNRPRAAISWQASSRSNTPATAAAAYSPTLWPSSHAGWIPASVRTLESAYCTAKIAGWAHPVWWIASSSPNISSRTETPSSGVIASSTSASARR